MNAILVTGSRGPLWVEQQHLVCQKLVEREPSRVVVGDAGGVDQTVREWCRAQSVVFETFRAHWTQNGKQAGPIRNGLMVARMLTLRNGGHSIECLAFPGPKSVGTYDCMRQAADYMQVTASPL